MPIFYSKVPNKRGATCINYRKNFQGLRFYLEGVRLSVLTKYFLKVEKVGFKIPNSMKFILFEEGGTLIRGGVCLLFLLNFPEGTFIWGTTLIKNSRVCALMPFFHLRGKSRIRKVAAK